MSIAEIIPEVLALSRDEKFQLARMLLDNLANEEPKFKVGAIYPLHTPAYSPEAAAQLARLLQEERTGS